ncbi:MAG TPA: GNAT family N-acetyltransferase, partial [Gaiellaceae bacterium]|nr:GNAT family N-acetyltransferase [Gaiellaceae bacterium]
MGSAGVVTLRAARAEEHERLRELTFRSKAHWGYDHELVRRWTDGLEFDFPCDRWAAEADGALVAWAALTVPQDGVAVLDHLWVDPARIGQGLGGRLFRLAAERARELGAERMEWGAEPNALGFYEKMGGRVLRDHVSEWGR